MGRHCCTVRVVVVVVVFFLFFFFFFDRVVICLPVWPRLKLPPWTRGEDITNTKSVEVYITYI